MNAHPSPYPEAPLRTFRAEFHIHTVLSPCASVEMIPPLIIQTAQEKGIDILAITDHNATANAAAVIQAAAGTGITVIPGVELHTREEIHILCLFPGLAEAAAFQEILDKNLPSGENQPDVWGPQYVVDATGEFICHEQRILSMATHLTLSQAAQIVASLNGLFIPAHIRRSMYGLLPTLGLLPQDVVFDALEIRPGGSLSALLHEHPGLSGYPFVCDGDAHLLDDILGLNQLRLREPAFTEICLALHRQNGREVLPL